MNRNLVILITLGILVFFPATVLSWQSSGTHYETVRYGQIDFPSSESSSPAYTITPDLPDLMPFMISPDGIIPGSYTAYDTLLTQASFLGAGDLENDGFEDLVSSSYFDGYIAVLHQNTTTHELELVAHWDITAGGSTNGAADVFIRDMNDDCLNDIVVFDVLNGLVVIYLQTDEYGVFTRTQVGTDMMYSRGGVDDLNNDHLADLLWTEGRYAYVVYQLPGGGFSARQTFTANTPPTRLLDQPVAGDVSGDGLADLVAADGYANNLLVWQSPNWQYSALYAPNNVSENVALGDLDRDGVLDMAVPGMGTNRVDVTWGESFTNTLFSAVGNMKDVTIGDVDDDEQAELIATDQQSYNLAIWNFTGRTATVEIINANVIPGQVIASDLNGDGLNDIAYGISGHTSPPHAPITVHYQTGEGEVIPRFPECPVIVLTPTPAPTQIPTPMVFDHILYLPLIGK